MSNIPDFEFQNDLLSAHKESIRLLQGDLKARLDYLEQSAAALSKTIRELQQAYDRESAKNRILQQDLQRELETNFKLQQALDQTSEPVEASESVAKHSVFDAFKNLLNGWR